MKKEFELFVKYKKNNICSYSNSVPKPATSVLPLKTPKNKNLRVGVSCLHTNKDEQVRGLLLLKIQYYWGDFSKKEGKKKIEKKNSSSVSNSGIEPEAGLEPATLRLSF